MAGTVKIQRRLLSDYAAENTFITLIPKLVEAPLKSTPSKHQITTRNKAFFPQYLIVRTGDTVSFPNLDPWKHNVFSLTENNAFDLGVHKPQAAPAHTFKKAGLVKVYCNIHPQMACFILVTGTRWAAVTDRLGVFAFKDVPAGEYILNCWNIRGAHTRNIQIRAGDQQDLEVIIKPVNSERESHLNKDSKQYHKTLRDYEVDL